MFDTVSSSCRAKPVSGRGRGRGGLQGAEYSRPENRPEKQYKGRPPANDRESSQYTMPRAIKGLMIDHNNPKEA
jgi:hypothetical protein